MFAPVAQALHARDAATVVISMDPFYQHGATQVARKYGVDVVEPEPPAGWKAPRSFYRRPAIRIWVDVLRARGAIDGVLAAVQPNRLVVGNDYALLEKVALALSLRRSVARRVLVQDGRISRARPRANTMAGRLTRLARRLGSPVLRRIGLPYLAASEYGEGGADVICAAGPRSADLLSRRSRGKATVVITGQPRYDHLQSLIRERGEGPIRTVAIFTTPYEAAGLGAEPQRRQNEMVARLRAALEARGIRVIVKPHPREGSQRYRQLVGDANVREGSASNVLTEADLAIIGISSLAEEAAILGCPVLTPGRFLHGDRFDDVLPDDAAYPRIDTPAELERAIIDLEDFQRRLELVRAQQASTGENVSFLAERPAAVRVADAILAP